MNKADLIDMVASETGSTKVDAAKALDAVVDAVTGALAKGDSVSLVGFGTFSVRHRAAREGINPQNPHKRFTYLQLMYRFLKQVKHLKLQ